MPISTTTEGVRGRGEPFASESVISPRRHNEIERVVANILDGSSIPKRADLGRVTSELARRPELWSDLIVHDADERWFLRLYRGSELDVWLLTWLHGQETDWHDHGGSAGSFAVASGQLREQWRRATRLVSSHVVAAGEHIEFGASHVHDVSHHGSGPAVSVHCYSPPLSVLTYYERHATGFTAVETVRGHGPDGRGWRRRGRTPGGRRVSIDAVLEEIRAEIERVSPLEAAQELSDDAVLIDIRPVEYRRAEGEVPGSYVIERNVLEWRLDPLNDFRIAEIAEYDRRIIVMCNDGYASSLAAADLQRLGLRNVVDLIGGYREWKANGFPTRPSTD